MNDSIKKAIENLRSNGFNVEIFENEAEVKTRILSEVLLSQDVGVGGSVTIRDMGLHEALIERGNNVYWHWLVEPSKRDEERKKASRASIYISSTNSITEDGTLVNIDGSGNRVASMFYGHERVYIVAGINKIVQDYDDAIKRIKTVACPQNAQRLNLTTPCRYTGKCNDCNSTDRMCRVEVILKRSTGNINVYLINKELGY